MSKNYSKASFAEIREQIIQTLIVCPKKIHEISKATGISRGAVINHVNYLWSIGRICPAKICYNSDEEYWMVRS